MSDFRGVLSGSGPEQPTMDRLRLRLGVLAILIIAAFVALFSRLWFLQVLAADEFDALAKQNRVRLIYSEPERGRILDRNGYILVDNRSTRVVTVDREIVETPVKKRAVFGRLSVLLRIPERELKDRLADVTVSPYKPVVIATDVRLSAAAFIKENPENFTGVHVETRPVRFYPQGRWAAQILGYVGEVTDTQLKQPYFKNARPRYQPGDIVGRSGVELSYDHELRGKPKIERVVVNASNKVVDSNPVQLGEPGKDLVTELDIRIQRIAEQALASGIQANRNAGYQATDGAAVVLDPSTGGVVAMASFPTYDPSILADGLQTKEYEELGHRTEDPNDDALINRTIGVAYSPGSTFKVPVAQSAMGLDIADVSTYLPCHGSETFGLNDQTFNNWTSIDFGNMGFARSLEVSCDTFYYQLGWEMEERWGAGNGDGTERFQKMLRTVGFDDPTGVDLPGEIGGLIPDEDWLDEYCEAEPSSVGCPYGWLPGYTVNMSIGQGEVLVTPLQMAMNYSSVVNGGRLIQPHLADYFAKPEEQLTTIDEPLPSLEPLAEVTVSPSASASASATPVASPTPSPSATSTFSTEPDTGKEARASLDDETPVKRIKMKVIGRVPLSPEELLVLDQGLQDVVMGDEGTAAGAFAGFPLDRFPIAGKTGTAQIGETDFNRAWFISYAPADDPKYVIAVYMNYAGHGGESAAPVAREIFEGIFGIDQATDDVSLGTDESG